LANACAKCCYVFNCSPEMDYQSMGNIFKGLASSGSWGCFDEFNRLVPEVLSVCSVQFKAVLDGIRGNRKTCTIEGDEVSLDHSCGAFITMNPGYVGRAELPEGLKVRLLLCVVCLFVCCRGPRHRLCRISRCVRVMYCVHVRVHVCVR
jgi:dynein heavy chain